MDTLEKTRIDIWLDIRCIPLSIRVYNVYQHMAILHLCGFLEAKLVILGPIDFLFGLPINLIVNAGQNKFEVDILKNVAKIANLRPKIGQIPLLSLDFKWHNSIIFLRILTFFILNCLFLRDESNSVQIKALSLNSFG